MISGFGGTLMRMVAAAGLVLGAMAPAMALDPTGIWEPDNKESRYEFTYCGDNGDRLCAELIWIREDVQDARNTKYLNTYIFSDARQIAGNQWKGNVSLEGFNIDGTLTMRNPDEMALNACALFVFCEKIHLTKVTE
ncbi:hypothetical protein [Pelagibacterium xiamenense]|uniref:hypothetical protein n=1 Tax=Pelagibacterium xiamenense TaxID=2901140 RepID=UPI001E356787|nr:hypothetical protein [Pelagibacterium xiamenense]MCD7060254.1 hypothetical protein [Pelagibacterium xiamenense]